MKWHFMKVFSRSNPLLRCISLFTTRHVDFLIILKLLIMYQVHQAWTLLLAEKEGG